MQQQSGLSYFIQGTSLIRTKGLKRFVLVPLFINICLFITAFIYLFGEIGIAINAMIAMIPDWLGFIKDGLIFILWPLALITVLLIFALVFGTLANWIAAPFNGLLSEKVEAHLTGQSLGDAGLTDAFKDIPRTLGREFRKLIYYIPRAIIFLVLFFVPVVGQLLWFMFNAWMMTIQYADYPFDNHKIGFTPMKKALRTRKKLSFEFGITVSICSLIPIVNFVVMPVAVCGATAMWVDEYKSQHA